MLSFGTSIDLINYLSGNSNWSQCRMGKFNNRKDPISQIIDKNGVFHTFNAATAFVNWGANRYLKWSCTLLEEMTTGKQAMIKSYHTARMINLLTRICTCSL